MRKLTKRQHEILRLRAMGKTGKEIAYDLGLADGTVKQHTTAAYVSLGAYSLPEALLALGWLRIPEHEEVAA